MLLHTTAPAPAPESTHSPLARLPWPRPCSQNAERLLAPLVTTRTGIAHRPSLMQC